MAEKTGQFKGIKQVLKETYDNAADKAGYLWFVRPTADAQSGDIYFGTRHYGRFDDNEVPKSGTDIKVTNGKIDVALSENITVAGLSDQYGCGLIKNGDTIKAGTSLMDIMKLMLSKEINPGAATKPSISISKAASASGLHEVGESVNVGTATIGKTAGKFNNNGWTTPAQPAAAFTWSNEKMSSILPMVRRVMLHRPMSQVSHKALQKQSRVQTRLLLQHPLIIPLQPTSQLQT